MAITKVYGSVLVDVELNGDYVKLPDGTTSERPETPASGMIRFNTTESRFEGYNGVIWSGIGGGGGSAECDFVLSDDTVQTLYLSVLPFYLKDGTFSPICLRAGSVPFLLEDGITIIDYRVN